MAERIVFLRARIQNLDSEQQALSSTLQNSTGGENQILQLLGTWIIEAKNELRQECEIKRRRGEELNQVELKKKNETGRYLIFLCRFRE